MVNWWCQGHRGEIIDHMVRRGVRITVLEMAGSLVELAIPRGGWVGSMGILVLLGRRQNAGEAQVYRREQDSPNIFFATALHMPWNVQQTISAYREHACTSPSQVLCKSSCAPSIVMYCVPSHAQSLSIATNPTRVSASDKPSGHPPQKNPASPHSGSPCVQLARRSPAHR